MVDKVTCDDRRQPNSSGSSTHAKTLKEFPPNYGKDGQKNESWMYDARSRLTILAQAGELGEKQPCSRSQGQNSSTRDGFSIVDGWLAAPRRRTSRRREQPGTITIK